MSGATEIRLILVTAFEPDAGPVPGEFAFYRDRSGLMQTLPFAAGYRPLHTDGAGTLALITGVGAARASASVMALGLDPRFDLTRAFWVFTGVAGISPERGSLGSVVLPEYVVDGTLTHELDAREIPAEWPDGYVPIGKLTPYEEPREDRFNGDDGIVFRLNAGLVEWAFELVRSTPMHDTAAMAARRVQFLPADPAHRPPHVLRGDELSSSTFFHGARMSARAARWVGYQTEGWGTYSITAMEDSGSLQALQFLTKAGLADGERALVVRAASNYDRQRVGVSAAESLAETRVASDSAYLPALENGYRVVSRIVAALRECWPELPYGSGT